MNINYLRTLTAAGDGAKQIKSVVDNMNANDFNEELQAVLPNAGRVKTRIARSIDELSKAGSALAAGDLPEVLSDELDAMASEQNFARGQHGQRGDFNKIKLRASERLRLQTGVAPQMLTTAMSLIRGSGQTFSPRKMNAMQAFGPMMQTLFTDQQLKAKLDQGYASMRLNEEFRRDQLEANTEIAHRGLDLRASAQAHQKREDAKAWEWNKDERDYRRETDDWLMGILKDEFRDRQQKDIDPHFYREQQVTPL